jgi:cytochrome d ubiquinol oxidase subunit II
VIELWFALLSFLIVVFVVLDGWDFGAGTLHLIVARTPAERREVVAALGPMWSWSEVWLLAAGGTFLLAFPKVMAVSFAGFYLALWMVLWALLLRGIALEVGGHLRDPMWQAGWDGVFSVSSATLAILFGAALGNVIRGVPLDATGGFSMPLFTDFRARGAVGILDWYTISVAIFTTLLLTAHGATYLVLKTSGPVHARSRQLAQWLWLVALILLPVITIATAAIRPELFGAMASRPLAWVATATVGGGARALWSGFRTEREMRALAGSCADVVGLLAGAAVGVFPVFLHSTLDPQYSMTAYSGAASPRGFVIALFWWPLAVALAFTYFVVVIRNYRGKVLSSAMSAEPHR